MKLAKILVVEDDPLVADAIRTLLDSRGYEVEVAHDGKEVMSSWQNISPDLIITDMVMPELDGVNLIRSIRASHPSLPVIAISGVGPESGALYLKFASLIGANVTLQKPFNSRDLLSAVSGVLAPAAA
jgi:DNA-binding response OmpR family regulator